MTEDANSLKSVHHFIWYMFPDQSVKLYKGTWHFQHN